MYTKYAKIAGAMALFLAVGTATSPLPVAASKSADLENAIAQFKTDLETAYASLSEADQALVYTTRYSKATTAIDTTESYIQEAKAYVPYVLFANTKEKATIYASLQDVMANVLLYETNIKAINAQYSAGTITAVAAMSQTTDQLEAIMDYVQEDSTKSAFQDSVKSVLKERLDSSLAYNKVALNALKRTKTAYDSMGQDTSNLSARLTVAQDSYDLAKASYDAAVAELNDSDDSTTGIKKFNQAARRMVIVQTQVLRAEQQADALEQANQYSPSYTTENE